jgi:hypothetical protein
MDDEAGPSCNFDESPFVADEANIDIEEVYDVRFFNYVKKKLGAKSYYLATMKEKAEEEFLKEKRNWDKKIATWKKNLSAWETQYMEWREKLLKAHPENSSLQLRIPSAEPKYTRAEAEAIFNTALNTYKLVDRSRKRNVPPPVSLGISIVPPTGPEPRMPSRMGEERGDPSKVFVYKYIDKKIFIPTVTNALRNVFQITSFTGFVKSGKDKKQILPPTFTLEDVNYVKNLNNNPEVDFILFPMQLHGKFHAWCAPEVLLDPTKRAVYRPTNEGIHNIVILYNKKTKQIEILDDDYGQHQKYFNYEDLIVSDMFKYMSVYLVKIFGLELPKYELPPIRRLEKGESAINSAVHLPMIREERYGHAVRILKEYHFPYDFSIVYKAFLANYLHFRKHMNHEIRSEVLERDNAIIPLLEDVDIQQIYRELQKRIGVRRVERKVPIETDLIYDFLELYEDLRTAKGEDIYNTSYIPSSPSETVPGAVLDPCPPGYIRNDEKVCVEEQRYTNLVKLSHYFLDYGKHFYPSHISNWYGLIMRYFADEYPNAAVYVPKLTYGPHPLEYAFNYRRRQKYKSTEPSMEIYLSLDLLAFLENALKNPKYSVILVTISITKPGYAHANLLVITKSMSPDKPHAVHRVEVNAPFSHEFGKNDDIDNAIKTYFKTEPIFSKYKFEYTNALTICPVAGHFLEYSEPTPNLPDLGGRCAEWELFYAEMVAANPGVEYKKLYKAIAQEIVNSGSAKHLIFGYIARLVEKARLYKLKDYNRNMHPELSKKKRKKNSPQKEGEIIIPSLEEQEEEKEEARKILDSFYKEIQEEEERRSVPVVVGIKRKGYGGKKKPKQNKM